MTPEIPITTATREVVEWLFGASTSGRFELDPDVERQARLLFLDTLGCAIGGSKKPELRTLNERLATIEPGSILLPGMTDPLSAPAAASWCAIAATWDEACEGLARAHGRPGLHSFPAALSLTLASGGSFRDALVALIRGYELAGRLGERLRIRPGMHVDGTWGTFGAVAAAGSVLGHDGSRVMAAIEAAGCQTPFSLYLPVGQGATIRNSYVGEAARRGISVVVAVDAGVTTTTGALDVLAQRLLDTGAPDATIAPPGTWLIREGYLKPFAAVRHVHYGAEAARQWRGTGGAAADITAIGLEVYPEAITYCANRAPRTAIEAQFSLTYGVAHMLAHHSLGPEAYTDAALAAPDVRRLEALIELRAAAGPRSEERAATLHVGTTDGEHTTVHVSGVAGDEGNPLSEHDVITKFRSYSQDVLADDTAQAIATAVIQGDLDTPMEQVIRPADGRDVQ